MSSYHAFSLPFPTSVLLLFTLQATKVDEKDLVRVEVNLLVLPNFST